MKMKVKARDQCIRAHNGAHYTSHLFVQATKKTRGVGFRVMTHRKKRGVGKGREVRCVLPCHQHTTSSLCVSLSLLALLGVFVSASFRTCFNHKLTQLLAVPHFVGHNTAAAGKVNTRQQSAARSKMRTTSISIQTNRRHVAE